MLCCASQPADLPPGGLFGVCFRSCGFEVLVCNVRFPRVFEHFFFDVFIRSCFFADFACVAILLFSGPHSRFCCFLVCFMLEGPFRLHFHGLFVVFVLLFLYFRRASEGPF